MKLNRILLIVIGVLYLFSGITKAIDSQWFAVLIATYGYPWAGNISPLISGLEIVLGLCLILNVKPKLSVILTGILTIVFTIVFIIAFLKKGVDDCGCMGPFIKIPAVVSLIRNFFIIVACYWIWSEIKNDEGTIAGWKKWVIYVVGALSFTLAGSTLGMQLVNKTKARVGDQIDNTYLRDYKNLISSGRSFVYIFSPGCGHCWNMTENVKTYRDVDSTAQIIGITYPTEDITVYKEKMHPNFEIYKYTGSDLGEIFEIPTLLVLENGKIVRIFKVDDIPCAQMLDIYKQQGK